MTSRLGEALRGARHAPRPAAPSGARRVLVAGGGGALGSAVLEGLLASHAFEPVFVLVTQELRTALRGLTPLAWPDDASPMPGAVAVVVFDRPRKANGREAAFFRPEAEALEPLARMLHARGVTRLVVVMPHTMAGLPQALQQGFATLDEQAVAALGFEQMVLVRTAQPPQASRSASALQRLADWTLSQLRVLVPQVEQPVRPVHVAALAVELARQLPAASAGTRVFAPEQVWAAAQSRDLPRFVADRLAGRPTGPVTVTPPRM